MAYPLRLTELVLPERECARVVRGGIKVEFNTGGLILYQDNVLLYPVEIAGLHVGGKQADGTIFAGISPKTNQPIYALPTDAPLIMKWERAMEYASCFEGHGHPAGTFRVPTQEELNLIFENHAQIGGFNETGLFPGSWYWSSTEFLEAPQLAWHQVFEDGGACFDYKYGELSLRLIRD